MDRKRRVQLEDDQSERLHKSSKEVDGDGAINPWTGRP
jgi:hypothetical protein